MKYGIKENAVGAKSVTKKAFYIKHKQLTKMALNLSVVFLGLAVIQGMSAAVVGQGINSCYLQTQQLSSQLGLAANSARLEVSSTALNNKNNIAAARQDIQLQLNALWGGANLATGPSAQICRNNLNLDLAPLDVQTLNVCYYNADVNILHSRVNQINNLKGAASQLCGACARQFPLPNQSEDLANCVSSGIENIQSQLASLQSEISSEAADLQAKSANCVQDAATNASGIISTASSNFDACIQSSST